MLRVLDRVTIGPAAAYAADTAEELRRQPADVAVCTDLLFGAMLGAEAAGTKLAVFGANISIMPLPGLPPMGPGLMPPATPEEHAQAEAVGAGMNAALAERLPVLNAARVDLGLAPLTDAFDQMRVADRILLGTSRAFDWPVTALPPNVRYVGPLLDQPSWVGAWTSPWPAADIRPLVVVAMSTTFQNQAGAIQAVLDAAADLPVRLVATRGPGLSGMPFRVPANAVVVDSAPHDALMAEASVVVTHCGHGSVMRALRSGRPLLCMPMGRDQNDNAARIAGRGAGLRLGRDSDAPAIRAALRRLLGEPAFPAASQRLWRAIAVAEPATALEDELEALAGCAPCTLAA